MGIILAKWIELNVYLSDDGKFNQVLNDLVKPVIKRLYDNGKLLSWHYFREPHLCWRIFGEEWFIEGVKEELDTQLGILEKENPEIYKNHFFGAFCEAGKNYAGEAELYGSNAWQLCYKRWEAGSNLALLLCTQDTEKSIPFHYTRDIHLMENQLGLELSDTITIYLKWVKKLMECDEYYKPYLGTVNDLIKGTWRDSTIKGI
jgi:hypothetical protein